MIVAVDKAFTFCIKFVTIATWIEVKPIVLYCSKESLNESVVSCSSFSLH